MCKAAVDPHPRRISLPILLCRYPTSASAVECPGHDFHLLALLPAWSFRWPLGVSVLETARGEESVA
jgi:hypothetical protein